MERFEHVCEYQNVRFEIQVVVLVEVAYVEFSPHAHRGSIVLQCHTFFIQTAEKCHSWWEADVQCFLRAVPVFIAENALHRKHVDFVCWRVMQRVAEIFSLQILRQVVERSVLELQRIDEPQVVYGEAEITLHVRRYAIQFFCHTCCNFPVSMQYKMAVVSTKIVEYDGDEKSKIIIAQL